MILHTGTSFIWTNDFSYKIAIFEWLIVDFYYLSIQRTAIRDPISIYNCKTTDVIEIHTKLNRAEFTAIPNTYLLYSLLQILF